MGCYENVVILSFMGLSYILSPILILVGRDDGLHRDTLRVLAPRALEMLL
jgi:hypothetical protein